MALIISVVTRPAPNLFTISRNGRLVIPDMGAIISQFFNFRSPIRNISKNAGVKRIRVYAAVPEGASGTIR